MNVAERTARLLVPWFFWCGVYGAAKLAEVLVSGRPLQTEFTWFMLGTGPSIHLWFLPFAFLLSLVQYRYVWPYRFSPNTFIVLVLLFIAVSLACFSIDGDTLFTPPWAQWLYVIPSAMFGTLLALATNSKSRLGIVASIASAVITIALLFHWTHGLLQFAISAALASLLLLNYSASTAISSALGRASMGVYLVHPLVLAVASRTTGEKEPDITVFLVVVIVSTGFALIAQRHSMLRRFV